MFIKRDDYILNENNNNVTSSFPPQLLNTLHELFLLASGKTNVVDIDRIYYYCRLKIIGSTSNTPHACLIFISQILMIKYFI